MNANFSIRIYLYDSHHIFLRAIKNIFIQALLTNMITYLDRTFIEKQNDINNFIKGIFLMWIYLVSFLARKMFLFWLENFLIGTYIVLF